MQGQPCRLRSAAKAHRRCTADLFNTQVGEPPNTPGLHRVPTFDILILPSSLQPKPPRENIVRRELDPRCRTQMVRVSPQLAHADQRGPLRGRGRGHGETVNVWEIAISRGNVPAPIYVSLVEPRITRQQAPEYDPRPMRLIQVNPTLPVLAVSRHRNGGAMTNLGVLRSWDHKSL